MIKRRLSESDITIPTLYILYKYGEMDTTKLKEHILDLLNPVGENLTPLSNRNDTKITQIIRNIISHRDSKNNIINAGLVNYNQVTCTLSLTTKGCQYLDEFFAQIIVEYLK